MFTTIKSYWVRLIIVQACLIMGYIPTVNGQEPDTVLLENVNITGQSISRYGIGSRTTFIDSSEISNHSSSGLAHLLQTLSPVYIKEQGNNMLSTVSFRGTGASHTAVLWHDLPIGYPMLGQSDLSLLPVYFMDQIVLQHGSSSSEYGSGAIGGIVYLLNNDPPTGLKIDVHQEFSSFNTFFSGLGISYSRKGNYLKARMFNTASDNNFKFNNNSKSGSPTENQENASYSNRGVELSGKIHLNSMSNIWFSSQVLTMNRDIQPSINSAVFDHQDDLNSRSVIGYEFSKAQHSMSVKFAHLFDRISFNDLETEVRQEIVTVAYETMAADWLTLKGGSRGQFIRLEAPFYVTEKVNENRTNIQGSALITFQAPLTLAINLRQTFVQGYSVPFTPSLGLEYKLPNKGSNCITIKSLLAKGFRVPTLNDRFWNPGGNPAINPEQSYNWEVGIKGNTGSDILINYDVSWYELWVNDWIIWLPEGSIWSPNNIKRVHGQGMEASSSISFPSGRGNFRFSVNYAFTKSTNQEGIDQYDRSVGKQLPYVPIHKGNLSGIFRLQSWEFSMDGNLTSKRFITTDNETSLPAYGLVNARIQKDFTLSRFNFNSFFAIDNLFNRSYQTIKNKAMPGISFRLGLTINYSKI